MYGAGGDGSDRSARAFKERNAYADLLVSSAGPGAIRRIGFPMPLGPGARLDAYEIVRPLGSGGMGEVWLATEVRLGRKVALKLLPAEVTRDPSRVLRFEQEARAASALSHPNVCTILAIGETGDGLNYIAKEYAT